MRVDRQTTLAGTAGGEGTGLHSGEKARLALRPGAASSGIVFRRMDARAGSAGGIISANPFAIIDARLGVRLANADGASVMTVEHLLSAFALCGVDNAIVEIDGPELPIFDGSAEPFVALIEEAGVKALAAPRHLVAIDAPIKVQDGDRSVEIVPFHCRRIELTIDYPDAAIGRRSIAFNFDDAAALARVASARTFCSLRDVEAMRASGFSLGGSLDNAIVVDGGKILNPSGLRDADEFALHKAADLIGDLALLGAPAIGLVRAVKPGHDLNTRLVRKIAAGTAAARSKAPPLVQAARA